MSISLPIENPVLVFALAMVIFLVAPRLLERFRIPGIVGLILAGMVVGPHVLGLLERGFTFELLGTVGLLYLIFQAGLELDLNLFDEYRTRSLAFGLVSFALPMALSLLLMPGLGYGWAAATLVGAVVGSHTLLAYPVARRLGITRDPAVITVVGGTLVTDVLALGVLVAVAGAQAGETGPAHWLRLGGLLAAFVAAVAWALPRVGRWFFRSVPGEGPSEFLFLMVALFVTAWGAELAGAEPIIGAFLAGLALNRLIPLTGPLMAQVRFVGNALFIPFFLLSVGMVVDPVAVMETRTTWITAGALVLMVVVGKMGGSLATGGLFAYDRAQVMTMFGLSAPQAAATLAVTFVGLELGLLGEEVVNAVVALILVTAVLGPTVVGRFGRRVALREERRAYDPTRAPRRILMPLSNPATADGLMDIAFALREDDPAEPVLPLMVVRGEGRGADPEVAEAEKILSHAVLYAADADVPVVPLTRVDPNVATGIARAATETRASVIVIGWDGRPVRGRLMGSVLDQMLEMTRQLVVVARLGHPLNTTERFVLLVPPGSVHHPGFRASALVVTTLAGALGARIEGFTVGEEAGPYREILEAMPSRVPVELERAPGWGPLLEDLPSLLRPDDLVVVAAGRPGSVAWSREMEQLPGRLAGLVPESFLLTFAPDAPVGGLPTATVEGLPTGLVPERVAFDLEAEDWREALGELFRRGVEEGLVERAVRRTAESEETFASRVRPEMEMPHALVPGLEAPLLFLGLSERGIRFPGTEEPARVILALLSPPRRREAHLRTLDRLSRTLRKGARPVALVEAVTVEEVADWFRKAET